MNKSDKDVAERLLSTTIENISRCMFDDFLMANAEATAKSGRNATITREEIAECCKWCKSLAGKYKYGTEPKDVYRRHDNCKCLVLFEREGEKIQDVHAKQRFENEKSARMDRIKMLQEQELAKNRFKRLHPINPVTNERFVDHKIHYNNQTKGRKLGKHMHDYGMNPGNEKQRAQFMELIENIAYNPDVRVFGEWRSQETPVIMHIKGDDVVIESNKGVFITILKGGITNERVRRALLSRKD